MISFKEYEDNIRDRIVEDFGDACGKRTGGLADLAEAYFLMQKDGVEVAFSVSNGFLLVRMYDGEEYFFIYPAQISEKCDIRAAIEDIRLYCIRQEIPFIMEDVEAENIGNVVRAFRTVNVDAESIDRMYYKIRAVSELDILMDPPVIESDGLTVSQISEEHTADYARLCRDVEVNKYWGYDYCDDVSGEVPDSYFVEEAEREFNTCRALSLAVEDSEGFIGEIVLHSFKLTGHAEIGFRIFKEKWGRGLGDKVLRAAFKYAHRIGLYGVYARVMNENEACVHLLSKYMACKSKSDTHTLFLGEFEGCTRMGCTDNE